MSKNFELMQQAGMERKIAPTPELMTAFSVNDVKGNGHLNGTGLDLDQIAQEESLKLLERVFLLHAGECPRAVVFAGIDPGDGCSRICADTAKTLARNVSGSVCLVDANLRSPSLHRFFGVTNHHGLADALHQEGMIRDFTQQLRPDNLWLLSCGSGESDSASLLSSDRLKTRLVELRQQYDYVLIDAPPLTRYADAIALGQLTDGVVLILEASSTRRASALKVTENLRAAQIRVLGAVLNKRTFPIPASLYHRL